MTENVDKAPVEIVKVKSLSRPQFIFRVFLVIIGLSIFSLYMANRDYDFDSEDWKSGDYITRGHMLSDLEDSGILIGKTEQEIEQLLGPPQRKLDASMTYEINSEIDLIIIGLRRREFISVFFDNNGKCDNTHLWD